MLVHGLHAGGQQRFDVGTSLNRRNGARRHPSPTVGRGNGGIASKSCGELPGRDKALIDQASWKPSDEKSGSPDTFQVPSVRAWPLDNGKETSQKSTHRPTPSNISVAPFQTSGCYHLLNLEHLRNTWSPNWFTGTSQPRITL